MSMIVIMPGGFHPFHAGHYSLYQDAKKKFPGADLYVAATNDMSERPFPFSLKEKLAKLAGVEPGHFIQVKSPFKAEEITKNYDPNKDVLVFVRSEKDRNEQPKPGGTKKDGSPAYFQPYTGKDLQPFSKHAYIDYLPTVEFGPGITSATQIRKAWPTLNDKRKLALVMSLYPATQKNSKLAQTVVGMFDQVMGGQLNENTSHEYILYINNKPAAKYNDFQQAERDVELIKQKHPTSKFEIKKEVCNMVTVPVGLKEALLRECGQDVREAIKPEQLAKLQQYKSELQRKQDAQRNAPLSPEKQQELDQWMRDFQASHGSRTVAHTQQAPVVQEPQKADWRTLPRQTRGKIKTQKQKLETLIRIGEKINTMVSRAERFPGGIPRGIQSDIETLEHSYDENNPDYDTMIEIYTKVAGELEQFINMKRALYRKTKTPRYESTVEDVLETVQQNPLIDLTPNFPNYSKLIGEFVGVQNNKIALKIIDAILKPGNKPAEKIAKAIANNRPIVMAPNYVKNRKVVSEFTTNDDGGDDQEEFFFKMAKQWWLGNEQQMVQVVKTLDKMGYEIGEDTGYDDGGVFIVKSGDQNGGSYMSWSHEDLSGLNEAANAAQQAAIAINMKKQGKKPKTNESADYLEEK